MTTVIDESGTTIGGEVASSTNPEKGRTGKCKKQMQTVWILSQLVIKNTWGMWPRINLRTGFLNNDSSFIIYNTIKPLWLE